MTKEFLDGIMIIEIKTATKEGRMKRDRHFYFMLVDDRILKAGYTNNIERRLSELRRAYKTKNIIPLWVSDTLMTEQAAKNNEVRIRKQIARQYNLRHIPTDRYELVENITLNLSIRSKTKINIELVF